MKYVRVRPVKKPQQATGDAGIDFFVPEDFVEKVLRPGEDVKIPSGIHVKVPRGFALIAFNKSGIATKYRLIKGAEVVDESYQGEVHIHVINAGSETVSIKPGQKLIQFILIPVLTEDLDEIQGLDQLYSNHESHRGAGGFGSTGE